MHVDLGQYFYTVRACMCACERVCVRECVRACVCARARKVCIYTHLCMCIIVTILINADSIHMNCAITYTSMWDIYQNTFIRTAHNKLLLCLYSRTQVA